MTPQQLARIPDQYLKEADTWLLRNWLEGARQTMTLLELDTERRRRGIRVVGSQGRPR